METSRRRIHYGWIIAATGAFSLFSCFGLARYAYSMLLPRMQASLGLSRASASFATVTIFFGIGQVIGPGGAGVIAKATGAFTTPYLMSAALTAIAIVLALLLPDPCGKERNSG